MRRFTTVIFALCVSAVLTGCGNKPVELERPVDVVSTPTESSQ